MVLIRSDGVSVSASRIVGLRAKADLVMYRGDDVSVSASRIVGLRGSAVL